MTKTIQHFDMTYHIYQRDDQAWDVEDVGGARPIELRAEGPWDNPEEAEAAVLAIVPEAGN